MTLNRSTWVGCLPMDDKKEEDFDQSRKPEYMARFLEFQAKQMRELEAENKALKAELKSLKRND